MKKCSKCKLEKSISEFNKNKDSKDGLSSWCKECYFQWRLSNKDLINKKDRKYKESYPWKITLNHINQRCNNPNHKSYNDYGRRGIKCLITADELKEIWFRDKAYLMKRPSIDRIDNDGNYEFGNCQYIEFDKNKFKNRVKTVLQFHNNTLITEYISVSEASRQAKVNISSISRCCNNIIQSAGGYVWKFKNLSKIEEI